MRKMVMSAIGTGMMVMMTTVKTPIKLLILKRE